MKRTIKLIYLLLFSTISARSNLFTQFKNGWIFSHCLFNILDCCHDSRRISSPRCCFNYVVCVSFCPYHMSVPGSFHGSIWYVDGNSSNHGCILDCTWICRCWFRNYTSTKFILLGVLGISCMSSNYLVYCKSLLEILYICSYIICLFPCRKKVLTWFYLYRQPLFLEV